MFEASNYSQYLRIHMTRTTGSWSGCILKKVQKPTTNKSEKQRLTALIQARTEHKELCAEKYAIKLYNMQLDIEMLVNNLQDIDRAAEDERDVLDQ